MDGRRRTVVEVRADLHQQLRKMALLNDLRIYVLANAIMEDALGNEEKVKVLIKRLKQEKKSVDFKSC
ncbi:MAG: hypothetical protein OQK25_08140 [Gammaproteobacteria bacterium]|nr:hypothetical protein [Gammaproteobacteria bacterium]